MRIGIDIDGVIMNTENMFRVKAELYDLLELNKQGQVNNELWAQKRYDWTEEQEINFRNKYLMEGSKQAPFMPGAIEVINLLKQEGHTIIIITARGGYIPEMKDVMEERFKEARLIFDKSYWRIEDKLEICQKEKIDIMIDDNASICKQLSNANVKTLYFRDVNREKIPNTEYLQEVNTWGEVYRKIYHQKMEEA